MGAVTEEMKKRLKDYLDSVTPEELYDEFTKNREEEGSGPTLNEYFSNQYSEEILANVQETVAFIMSKRDDIVYQDAYNVALINEIVKLKLELKSK